MRAWSVILAFGFFLILRTAFAQTIASHEASEKAGSNPEVKLAPKITVLPIREEVKILRRERRKKMPYLDKGFMNEKISPKTIKGRQNFELKKKKVLKDLIDRALEVYTPAKASQERVSLAKRRILVAARSLLPEASFNFEFRDGTLSGSNFTGDDYHALFRVPVFRGGILWNTLLKEKAEYRAAKKEYEAVLNQMVSEVASAYYEFNRAQEVYEDKMKVAEQAKKQYAFSKEKFKQGLTSEIEYLNVESMAGQMEYDVQTAKQELELAKLELSRFIDVTRLEDIEIARLYDPEALVAKAEPSAPNVPGEPERKPFPSQDLEELVDLAYLHRPELQVEAARLRSARLEERIRRGAFLPRADMIMEFGELGEAFTRDTRNPTHTPEWRAGLEVSTNLLGSKIKYTRDHDENAPSVSQFLQGTGSRVSKNRLEVGIFDGLEDFAELKEAQVKKLEQVIELEKKEQEVVREVKEAYFDYQKARIQVESSLKRNQYRQKLVELAQARLDKAEIEISEYLQAELDLTEERARLHGALADLFKAKSKLNQAIGIRDFVSTEEPYGL